MNEEKNLQNIIKQIKGLDDGINSMIVPMLKDTINDYKKTFNKMVVIIIILIIGLLGVIGYSQYLIAKQNDKYNEFLSQFEFEGESHEYDYTQDLDSTDGGDSIINDGINVINN